MIKVPGECKIDFRLESIQMKATTVWIGVMVGYLVARCG